MVDDREIARRRRHSGRAKREPEMTTRGEPLKDTTSPVL
jgi:hypothetical protein